MGPEAMQAQKIVVRLPEDVVERTNSLMGQLHTSRNSFICEAVEEKLEKVEKERLATRLREGYLANADYYAASHREFEEIVTEARELEPSA